jgi:hypothetical protein
MKEDQMAKGLRHKPAAEKEDSGNTVQKNEQYEIAVKFIASQGNGHRDVLLEEFRDRIKKAISAEFGGDVRFTSTGGYYLVAGKVCMPEDFDPETMDRKPGTHPPSWAADGDEKKAAIEAERAARAAENQRIFAVNAANKAKPAEKEDDIPQSKKLKPRKGTVPVASAMAKAPAKLRRKP